MVGRQLILGILVLTAFAAPVLAQAVNYREARLKMVEEELVREGLKNKAVLDALRNVPRHLFVTPDLRPYAYYDQALAIGHQQTISPPFIVAYMTEILDPQPEDRVLEIGTGSGYQAAILSGIVKEVYSIEIVPELGESAAKLLKELHFENVKVKVGDGYKGWDEHAPFDKIIVTCSPEKVPQPLVDQLKEGGRMIVPLGERYTQVFHLFEKKDGKLVQTRLLPTIFVPMTGRAEEERTVKADPNNPQLRNGGFEEDADKDGRPDEWYYQRQAKFDTKASPEGKLALTFENKTPGRGSQVLQAMPLNGEAIGSLGFELMVKATNIRAGTQRHEIAGGMLHFFDDQRRPIAVELIGPWRGSFAWKQVKHTLHVPPGAREAILRIGLNGATGTLSLDEIAMKPQPRP